MWLLFMIWSCTNVLVYKMGPYALIDMIDIEWVVFTRPYRRCCICSANYCKFCLISLLVWLVDVIALFPVMWPLSWYQFCVSLPLEVRTVGLVLFLQVLTTLCFTLLAASRSCWACVQWQRVQCSRASQQPWATQHREESVVCHLCRPCPPLQSTWPSVSGNRCRTSPFLSPQLIARLSHLGIARNVPRKPRRSRRGGKSERRKIKVTVGFRDRLSSDSSSSPTPCQHTTSVPPSSPPSDRDDLSAASHSP